MTDATTPVEPGPGDTAGALLRRAREKQGLHIAALAASIKVAPRKLEALEADRYDELPDATFTRALAQTVCRTLKIDAAPVLALLPRAGGAHRLEQVAEGINAPFHDRGAPSVASEWRAWLRPAVIVPVLLGIAAAVLWFLPARLGDGPLLPAGGASSPVSAPASGPRGTVSEPVPSHAGGGASAAAAPASVPGTSGAAPALPAAVPTLAVAQVTAETATPPPATLQLRTSAPSWIEVVDGAGRSMISRIVEPGETVDLDGPLPLRLRIGNAAATQVSFRGQAVDLAPSTRENVARFDLR